MSSLDILIFAGCSLSTCDIQWAVIYLPASAAGRHTDLGSGSGPLPGSDHRRHLPPHTPASQPPISDCDPRLCQQQSITYCRPLPEIRTYWAEAEINEELPNTDFSMFYIIFDLCMKDGMSATLSNNMSHFYISADLSNTLIAGADWKMTAPPSSPLCIWHLPAWDPGRGDIRTEINRSV